MQERSGVAGVVAVLLADAVLEVADAATFWFMAITAVEPLGVDELAVVASLVVPRLIFAGLAVHVGRRLWRGEREVLTTAAGLLLLIALQAAAGLFMLWGAADTAGGRAALVLVNGLAAAAVARSCLPQLVRLLADRRRDAAG